MVRPIPPGQVSDPGGGSIVANVCAAPLGDTSMIVVPVPCTLALSLKLLTSVSPLTRVPMVSGTMATPYGFTSPLSGTVEDTCLGFPSVLRKGGPVRSVATDAPATAPNAAKVTPVTKRIMSDLRVALGIRITDIRPPTHTAIRLSSYARGIRRGHREGSPPETFFENQRPLGAARCSPHGTIHRASRTFTFGAACCQTMRSVGSDPGEPIRVSCVIENG